MNSLFDHIAGDMAFPLCPTILMIRKLPPDLSKEEATDLFQYFGAKSVSVMSSKGHMKGSAFAEFSSKEEADIALKKLHQALLFGSRLIVQYSDKNFMPYDTSEQVVLPPPQEPVKQTNPTSEKVFSTPDPSLHYLYPPPTTQTLSNISHALVAVPQFYIQVLHLMNKMNLPPPFSKSSEKSIFETTVPLQPPLPSSSESELESDPEEPQELGESEKLEIEKEILEEKRIATQAFLEKHVPDLDRKRKRRISESAPEITTKSSKLSKDSILNIVEMDLSTDSRSFQPLLATSSSVSEIRDETLENQSTVNTVNEVREVIQESPTSVSDVKEPAVSEQPEILSVAPSSSCNIPGSSPGKVTDNFREEKLSEHQKLVKSRCLTPEQFAEHAVFKKYVRGEPSNKLYIKNLNHKNVEEKELEELFLPYQEYFHGGNQNPSELQIKLMTRGQMKGQAFITFSSTKASEAAMSDLHGFVLHGKPMAIMFAKSK